MSEIETLSAELEALKQRVALLEAAEAKRTPRMAYNWHLRDPEARRNTLSPMSEMELTHKANALQQPSYEHYIDPSMRLTRNGN